MTVRRLIPRIVMGDKVRELCTVLLVLPPLPSHLTLPPTFIASTRAQSTPMLLDKVHAENERVDEKQREV